MSSKKTRLEAGQDQDGSIFSISGPVIVAENMIGCAMYEMVSAEDALFCDRSLFLLKYLSSVELVMTSWLEKLFGLMVIETSPAWLV